MPPLQLSPKRETPHIRHKRFTCALSKMMVAPASTTIAVSFRAAASRTVVGPMVGRSNLKSWPGAATLTRTAPGPGARDTRASVPSLSSRSKRRPRKAMADWPRPKRPTRSAPSSPALMDSLALEDRQGPAKCPGVASNSPSMDLGSPTRTPALTKARAAARKIASPRPVSDQSAGAMPPRSKRSSLRAGHPTEPTKKTSSTPARRNAQAMVDICPGENTPRSLPQSSETVESTRATTGSMPLSTSLHANSPGSAPFPATMPRRRIEDSASNASSRCSQKLEQAPRFVAGFAVE
jgi:hypothetical protein